MHDLLQLSLETLR